MQCPLCRVKMSGVSSEGTMLLVCPQCDGVWFRQGQLFEYLGKLAENRSSDNEPKKLQGIITGVAVSWRLFFRDADIVNSA